MANIAVLDFEAQSASTSTGKIISVSGRPGPANKSRLCVKGRYGFDYISNPERLTKPLIRLKHSNKKNNFNKFDSSEILLNFREASWEEALKYTSDKLREFIQKDRGIYINGAPVGCDFEIGDDYSMGKFDKMYA